MLSAGCFFASAEDHAFELRMVLEKSSAKIATLLFGNLFSRGKVPRKKQAVVLVQQQECNLALQKQQQECNLNLALHKQQEQCDSGYFLKTEFQCTKCIQN